MESGNDALARQLVFDYRQAELDPADRALCDFAVKLTLAPGQMHETDIKKLRKHGLTDEQITVATQVIGYFNYITRVAQGLGVEHEPWMDLPIDQWLREKGSGYFAAQ